MATPNEDETVNVNQITGTETEEAKSTVISQSKGIEDASQAKGTVISQTKVVDDTSQAKSTVITQSKGLEDASQAKGTVISQTKVVDDTSQAKSTVISQSKGLEDASQAKGTVISQTKVIDDTSQSKGIEDASQAKSADTSQAKGTVISQSKGNDNASQGKGTVTSHAKVIDDETKAKGTVISQSKGIEDASQAKGTVISQTKVIDDTSQSKGIEDASQAKSSDTSQAKGTVISQSKGNDNASQGKGTVISHAEVIDDETKAKGTVISQSKGIEDASQAKSADISLAKGTVIPQSKGNDNASQGKGTVISHAEVIDDETKAKGTVISQSKGIEDASQAKGTVISQTKVIDNTSQAKNTVISQSKGIDDASQGKTTVLSEVQGVDNASQGKSNVSSTAQSIEMSQSKSIDILSQDKSLNQSEPRNRIADENKLDTLSQTQSYHTVESTKSTTSCRKRVTELKKVCIVGAGNWGTVIAKIIGTNITQVESFNDEITLFVKDEIIDGKTLSDIINETHENIKYLPGQQLPKNVIAVPDVVEAAREAHIIIFTLQQEYLVSVCTALVGKIKPTAAALCLTKGFQLTEDGNVDLYSQIITRHLKIQTSVLMGANLYDEIAKGLFCEATLGCKDKLLAVTLKDLIQTEHLRVSVVDDVDAVEVCGALRNVVACGVGFVDGMDMGRSAKGTIIRLGLIEMIKFVDMFYPGSKVSTFFESCGVTDLVTCYLAGRNRQISEKFVTTKTSISEFENELLGGHVLEGPFTAKNLNFMLRERDLEHRFPLFTAIYRVYAGELEPSQFLDNVLGNLEHTNVRLNHLTW